MLTTTTFILALVCVNCVRPEQEQQEQPQQQQQHSVEVGTHALHETSAKSAKHASAKERSKGEEKSAKHASAKEKSKEAEESYYYSADTTGEDPGGKVPLENEVNDGRAVGTKPDKLRCSLIIEQRTENFTGYIIDEAAQQTIQWCKSRDLLKDDSASNPSFDDGNGNFKDIAMKIVNNQAGYDVSSAVGYYTKLWGRCMYDVVQQGKCGTFRKFSAYITGTIRRKALKDVNAKLRSQWERETKDSMKRVIQDNNVEDSDCGFEFQFLPYEKQCQMEGLDFFSDNFNMLNEVLKTPVDPRSVIGFRIGRDSTEAFAYSMATNAVQTAGNELVGTMEFTDGTGMKSMIKELLVGVTGRGTEQSTKKALGLGYIDGSIYTTAVFLDSLKNVAKTVLAAVDKCACGGASYLDWTCKEGSKDPDVCKDGKRADEAFRQHDTIECATIVSLSTYVVTNGDEERRNWATFLQSVSTALVDFGIKSMIINDGTLPHAGNWVNQVMGFLPKEPGYSNKASAEGKGKGKKLESAAVGLHCQAPCLALALVVFALVWP